MKMKKKMPTVSIIVPFYNVEEYLKECIDSLLNQDVPREIILVNDGSTDSSGIIADSYQQTHKQITVIHQENQGVSAARNVGLIHANGEYVLFIDSDDWVEKNSIKHLYIQAIKSNADMVLGGTRYCYSDKLYEPYAQILEKYHNNYFTGKEWFSTLFASGVYYLLVYCYMYRRQWLIDEKLHFENVIHEDELWVCMALSKAQKVAILNNTFYNYRQRPGSIMHSLHNKKRLKSLFYIANSLTEYSHNYTFKEDREFKSWFWVEIMRLYSIAFNLMLRIKDSSFILPKHYLYIFPQIYYKLYFDSKSQAKKLYLSAKRDYGKYLLWRNHLLMQNEYNDKEQQLILFYNNPEEYLIQYEKISNAYFVTTDWKYIQDALIVIFHMQDLDEYLDDDLYKPNSQIWASWHENYEEYQLFLQADELLELFDLHIIGIDHFEIIKNKTIMNEGCNDEDNLNNKQKLLFNLLNDSLKANNLQF